MSTVIRMASHAYHYLTVFDNHTGRALHLGRNRRIATADQRIVLHARDRSVNAPAVPSPGSIARYITRRLGGTEWIPPPHLDWGHHRISAAGNHG
jgi:hypothetical protein